MNWKRIIRLGTEPNALIIAGRNVSIEPHVQIGPEVGICVTVIGYNLKQVLHQMLDDYSLSTVLAAIEELKTEDEQTADTTGNREGTGTPVPQ